MRDAWARAGAKDVIIIVLLGILLMAIWIGVSQPAWTYEEHLKVVATQEQLARAQTQIALNPTPTTCPIYICHR